MPDRSNDIAAFIRSSFGSIWTLEVFLHLKRQPWANFNSEQLVSEMRASETVVLKAVSGLAAAGLIIEDEPGSYRYGPASTDIADLAGETEALYQRQPNVVRRLIVVGADNLKAFSDAFKLGRGEE